MNNCKSCGGEGKHFKIPSNDTSHNCSMCDRNIDATCISYSGQNLGFVGGKSNITLEELLLRLDSSLAKLSISDWNYNYSCLDSDFEIKSQKDFVEVISSTVCEIKDFTNRVEQLPNFVSNIDERVTNIENPNLTTNSFVGITSTDNYIQVIGKLSTAINILNSRTNLSGVDWDKVYTVTQTPTTVAQGFDEILNQIEKLYNTQGGVLPVFDTTNTCLPTKDQNTPLHIVIKELYESYCSTSAVQYDGSSVVWGCIPEPSSDSLEDAVKNLASHLSDLYKYRPSFDSEYFEVEEIANCQGYSIKIKDGVFASENKVLVDANSNTPQFLYDALEEGDNVSLSVNGDRVKIDVAVNPSDDVSVTGVGLKGPLNDVLVNVSDPNVPVTVTKSVNSSGQLQLGISINYETLVDNILNTVRDTPSLLDKLCNINCSCQSCS